MSFITQNITLQTTFKNYNIMKIDQLTEQYGFTQKGEILEYCIETFLNGNFKESYNALTEYDNCNRGISNDDIVYVCDVFGLDKAIKTLKKLKFGYKDNISDRIIINSFHNLRFSQLNEVKEILMLI